MSGVLQQRIFCKHSRFAHLDNDYEKPLLPMLYLKKKSLMLGDAYIRCRIQTPIPHQTVTGSNVNIFSIASLKEHHGYFNQHGSVEDVFECVSSEVNHLV